MILDSCRMCLEEINVHDLRVSHIAKGAGIAPGGLYRYFESKESIVIEVMLEDIESFTEVMELEFTSEMTLEQIAKILVEIWSGHRRLMELIGVVAPVLERDVSVDRIVEFKQRLQVFIQRMALRLHIAQPSFSLQKSESALSMIGAMMAGIYPTVNPSENVREAYTDPSLSFQHITFEEAALPPILIILRGIEQSKEF